jgi:hypothetical protein
MNMAMSRDAEIRYRHWPKTPGQGHIQIYDMNMNPNTRIDVGTEKSQIFQAFLDRESDTKSKILNRFFVIFAFVLPILYFCVIKMQDVPSKNRPTKNS